MARASLVRRPRFSEARRRLLNLCERLGRPTVAARLGISRCLLGHYLTGARVPSSWLMVVVQEHFDIGPRQWFLESSEVKESTDCSSRSVIVGELTPRSAA
jgi:hypothetical protein